MRNMAQDFAEALKSAQSERQVAENLLTENYALREKLSKYEEKDESQAPTRRETAELENTGRLESVKEVDPFDYNMSLEIENCFLKSGADWNE